MAMVMDMITIQLVLHGHLNGHLNYKSPIGGGGPGGGCLPNRLHRDGHAK